MSAIALPTSSRPSQWIGLVAIGALIMLMGSSFITRGVVLSPAAEGGGEYTGDCSGSTYVDFNGLHYPDESCTGYEPTGVSLTAYTGGCTITTNGTTIDSKTINCNPLNINANSVTITRSAINGVIRLNSATRTGILIEDTTIDGQNASGGSGGQCIGDGQGTFGGATAADYKFRRVRVVGCEQAFYGRGFWVEYSYAHDLYCLEPDHVEAALPNQGDTYILYSTLDGHLRQDDCGASGQASAVIALYTHDRDGWANPFDDGQFIGNYLEPGSGNGDPGYCVYSGEYVSGGLDDGVATNTIWKDNVFGRGSANVCGVFGPVYEDTGPDGTGSCWSNNRYENNGALINVSDSPPCP